LIAPEIAPKLEIALAHFFHDVRATAPYFKAWLKVNISAVGLCGIQYLTTHATLKAIYNKISQSQTRFYVEPPHVEKFYLLKQATYKIFETESEP
jgi:hypothetical protein